MEGTGQHEVYVLHHVTGIAVGAGNGETVRTETVKLDHRLADNPVAYLATETATFETPCHHASPLSVLARSQQALGTVGRHPPLRDLIIAKLARHRIPSRQPTPGSLAAGITGDDARA